MGPALDFSVEAGAMPGLPRLLNLVVTFDRINENGEFVPTGEFADMTEAVQAG